MDISQMILLLGLGCTILGLGVIKITTLYCRAGLFGDAIWLAPVGFCLLVVSFFWFKWQLLMLGLIGISLGIAFAPGQNTDNQETASN